MLIFLNVFSHASCFPYLYFIHNYWIFSSKQSLRKYGYREINKENIYKNNYKDDKYRKINVKYVALLHIGSIFLDWIKPVETIFVLLAHE